LTKGGLNVADWDEEIPPIMKEKLAEIGDVGPEEKQRMRELDGLDSMLRDFYKGELDAYGLYERLKDFEKSDKQFLLREAYEKLKRSFKWKGLPIKFEESASGKLAVEFREQDEQEEGEEEGLVFDLNDANFDQLLNKYPLMVVDCWAPWCAPCRMVAPVVEELARDYQGKIAFGKLNVDNNRAVAARFGIMSIPTLLIFKDGQLVDQKVGAMPKQVLEGELTKFLG
jgi:thioredoxin 1